MSQAPAYLADHAELYRQDPRRAALAWFREARYGLFLHYGLYSLLGRHEWVQWREAIPVAEYALLKDRFTAEGFDADAITDLAVDAGMTYVNLTTRHHDGFCLFRTAETDFSSVSAPCGRDLVGELAEACARRGLGLFLYNSYALDWRHPHFFDRGAGWPAARPDYAEPEPTYLYRNGADFRHYIAFAHAQIRELLTQYGPVAGLWFDPVSSYYTRPDLFPIEETYALIRSLQPQTLIAFKQGASGDEDFASCERHAGSLEHRFTGETAGLARRIWEMNRGKHNEICATMQPRAWGYTAADDAAHLTADEVVAMATSVWAEGCNLLLNTGPLPDGDIPEVDAVALREAGQRLTTGR